ncbi:Phosphoglycolate phosphatase, HAD superfamily [Nitrosomonas marina]|uniref:phosphoglycolate phosphatase n=1 Tax=Nitrosomonas marina TaxID=917 RepID=A0A1I0BWS3_9PROT|nr:HAD family hydrolase [Nitrosomonas marina]SET11476.1 Phosphoglycolate phosphatase, HAD superfamily [Nitrosomonas marina]
MIAITNFEAIIFDFDGVIAESGEIKTQAFAELYRPYGEAVVTEVVRYHTANGGLSRYNKFRHFQQQLLHGDPLTSEEEKELDLRFSELVVEAVVAADAVPGAYELIHQQNDRIPLFVASGTPEAELKVIVERRGLTPYFKQVRGAPKLKPVLIAEILSDHALDPNRVLMIGDALADYEGAQANKTAFLGRVRPGDNNPFPPGTPIVPDLRALVI